MADSGYFDSWKLNTGTIDGKSCAGAYYRFSWTSEEASHGTTTVSWKLYGKGRSDSPTKLENTIDLDLYDGSTKVKDLYTITDSDGDAQTSFKDYLRASGTFNISHSASGAATFTVKMNVSIWDTATHLKEETFTLNTNKPDRTLTLTGRKGTSNYTGGGAHRVDSSVTINTTVANGYTWSKWTKTNASGDQISTTKNYTFNMPSSNVTYYANVTLNSYKIAYDLNSGAWPSGATKPDTYNIESAKITVTNPEREGYQFGGWTGTGINSTANPLEIATGSTGDRSYKATWNGNPYKVRYNSNNGSGSMSNSNHVYGTSSTLRKNTFTRSYTVTYNANGGSCSTSSQTASYTFTGWATTASGSKVYNDEHSVSKLTTKKDGIVDLYAVWSGGSVTLPTPSKTGYNFNGWYTAVSNGTKVGNAGASYTPGANKTVYALWTEKKFTVTFDKNGGSTPNPTTKSVTYDSTYGTLPTITKDGYQFEGWYTSASGGTKVTSATKVTITADQTLHAHWTAYTLTINYTAGGGVQGSGSSHTLPYSNTVSYGAVYNSGDGLHNAIKTLKLEKTGYHLDTGKEWKTSTTGTILSDATNYTPAQLAAADGKDLKVGNVSITVTPNWIADTDTIYTVNHWKQKVGAAATQTNANYEAEVETKYGTTGHDTEAEAKTFTGFTLSSTITQKKIAADGSTVIDIYYTRNSSYKLTLSKGNGIETVSGGGSNKQYGASISIQSTTKAGYTFSKWTSSVSSVVVPSTNSGTIKMPPSDLTLTASATANKNTPYVVKHWKQKLSATSTTGNTTNYTEVSADRQSLTGETDKEVTPNVKSYVGFTAPSKQTVTIKGDGSTVVNYYYTRNSYAVTLNTVTGVDSVNISSEPKAVNGKYKYESSIIVTAVMDSGYLWDEGSRWVGSGVDTSSDNPYEFTMPATDVTLTATPTADTYTVTYVANGGKQSSGSTSDIVDSPVYDANYTVRNESRAFSRTGYKFMGWTTVKGSKDVDQNFWDVENNTGKSFTWKFTDDVTLYAIWKSKGVLYVDDGSNFVPYTIWIDSGNTTGGPLKNGWYQYTAWLDTGDTSQGKNGWVQLGSLPD